MRSKPVRLAALLAASLLLVSPWVGDLAALTNGPTQPEFATFEPVTTTDMVDLFHGAFTYNLPVLEVPGAAGGGYALSLSYHSGTSPEDEGSWVGYGWTLNPGAIVRQRRGLPDDFKGRTIRYRNRTPSNDTVSIGGQIGGLELFSVDVPANLSATLRYNNRQGFGYTLGAGLSLKGLVSLGYSVSDGEGSFSLTVNPGAALAQALAQTDGNENARERGITRAIRSAGRVNLAGSQYGVLSHAEAVRATTVSPYDGVSVDVSVSVEPTPGTLPVGTELGLSGSFSHQANAAEWTESGFGYLYSGYATNEDVMDYGMEKELPYQKRDKFLAIPFSSPDVFQVTGEGLGGSFRLFSRTPGHFHPSRIRSETALFEASVEVQAGVNIGVGADVAGGLHSLEVQSWEPGDDGRLRFPARDDGDEPYFFRFIADAGGTVAQAVDDGPVQADLAQTADVPGFMAFTPRPPLAAFPPSPTRAGRSSYIAFHTNGEMADRVDSPGLRRPVPYRSYTHQEELLTDVVARTTDAADPIRDGIGEIVIWSEDGTRYVYGLPVYARNEVNLSYGASGARLVDRHLAYVDVTDGGRMLVGTEQPDPYATTFLLTEITTPDYVDRTLDGATPDDLGGYTRFHYAPVYGTRRAHKDTGADWYRWRVPYTGLLYEPGSLSDPADDVGTVMAGEKEIYYLDAIETKTHVARFHRSDRADAVEAAANDEAARNAAARGSRRLQKLDRIDLFAKGRMDRPIRTVHFAYDYSLMPGTPNSQAPGGGRLTLRRVWFESEGVTDARIRPYVFGYEYRRFGYPAPYTSLDDYGGYPVAVENPPYDARNVDRWGYYQADGAARHDRLDPWVSQAPDSDRFDPAAWQLKSIRLPTGGEIHVQYEAADYRFVQERPAMAMVRLLPGETHPYVLGNKFYLRTDGLGMRDAGEIERLRQAIEAQFVDGREKAYFKFLYRLSTPPGIRPTVPDLTDCNQDYVSGYVDVKQVGVDGRGLYVVLGGDASGVVDPGVIPDDLEGFIPGLGDLDTPRKICMDFVKTQRAGKLVLSGACNAGDGVVDSGSPLDVVVSFLAWLGTTIVPSEATLCLSLSPELSYLRVPVVASKRGGGIRVKRLLRFDPGLEPGDAALYGSEYVYRERDVEGNAVSSGVATTEPADGREENSLVRDLPRDAQDFLSRIIAGRDRKQVEGPLGETLLPAPSVGYSKVIVRNIHSGPTDTGMTVNEYFTARDYPLSAGTDRTPLRQREDWMIIPAGLFNYNVNNLWLSQGFSFVQSAMNGRPRRTATYTRTGDDPLDPDTSSLSASVDYEYFAPGEPIPVLDGIGRVQERPAGREVEVVFESKKIEDLTDDVSVEVDFDIGLAGAIPITFGSAFPSISHAESRLHTHATAKVVRYPALVKATDTYQDGVLTRVENVAFDPATGRPVRVRSFDGFDGLTLAGGPPHVGRYDRYTFPASGEYPLMGSKARDEGIELRSADGLTLDKRQRAPDRILLSVDGEDAAAVCDALAALGAGALVEVRRAGDSLDGIYHVGETVGNEVELLPTFAYPSTIGSALGVGVTVLRSGRTNELTAASGTLATYGPEREPVLRPIAADVLAPRQRAADQLNATLREAGTTTEVEVSPPADLSVRDASGECAPRPPDCRLRFRPGTPGQIPDTIGVECGACRGAVVRRPGPNERFVVDPETGELLYQGGDGCTSQPVPCLDVCPDVYSHETLDGVIQAGAQTFADDWELEERGLSALFALPPSSTHDPYERAAKGKWRAASSFTYRTGVITANGDDGRVYRDAGVFEEFTLFDWRHPAANDTETWLLGSVVTACSPHGEPIEEHDIDGVQSVAKLGYHHTVPYLVAQNTDYESVAFESFESLYPVSSGEQELEDGIRYDPIRGTLDAATAHAGQSSLALRKTLEGGTFRWRFRRPLTLTPTLESQGLSFKVWMRSADPRRELDEGIRLELIQPGAFGETVRLTAPMTRVARTGEWVLLAAAWSAADLAAETVSGHYQLEIEATDEEDNELWIDDLRLQPLDAAATAYVYDPRTLHLVARFDGDHFGEYFQYDGEGRLVRRLLETERGVKTIDEAAYHTPSVSRFEE